MPRTVILVHGTFAAPKAGVTQWYQGDPGTKDSFAGRVEAALRADGDTRPIVWQAFTWSGKNDHGERLKAAAALCEKIQRLQETSPGEEICLIAHSHGGNVALKALELVLRGGSEASAAFDVLLRALGVERLNAQAATERVIGAYRIPDSPLSRFVKNAATFLMFSVRIKGLPPPGASSVDLARWLERMRRSYLVRWMIEPFSLRWNAERRPRVQLITLGTPFFQKSWLDPSPGQQRANRVVGTVAAVAAIAAAIYCIAVALTSVLLLAGLSLGVPVSSLFLSASLCVLIIFTSAWFARQMHWRGDTNIYFAVPRGIIADQPPEGRARWRLLAIHTGLLDEALLGLSTEPLVAAGLGPVLRRPLVPPLQWHIGEDPIGLFAPTTPIIGDFARLVRQGALVAALWIYNLTVGFVIRTLAWSVALVAHQLLLNTATRLVSSVGMGVGDDELRGARMHVVPVPSIEDFFAQEAWDATHALIEEPAKAPGPGEQQAQWKFLSDPQALAAAIEKSVIWPFLEPRGIGQSGLDSEAARSEVLKLQRISVALEQRICEALGLVPLNHSSYYDNPTVIERVSRAMKMWSDLTTKADAPGARTIQGRTLPGNTGVTPL